MHSYCYDKSTAMKKIALFITTVLLAGLLISCERERTDCDSKIEGAVTASSTAKEDSLLMVQLAAEIYELSGTANCNSSDGWAIIPIGHKPCGGAAAYIAYKTSVDKECFLAKVKHFTEQSKKYTTKYGLFSDCMITPKPSSVKCENGKAVFVY